MVADMKQAFPDQKDWIMRVLMWLRRGGSNVTFKGLMDAVGYDGPPQLFTMYGCLFEDKVLKAVKPEAISDNMDQIQQQRKVFRKQLAFDGHPAVIVSHCCS